MLTHHHHPITPPIPNDTIEQMMPNPTSSLLCLQLCLLEGQGEVVLAGLAVPHQVTRLFAQPEQGLGVSAADGSVVPAETKTGINKWVVVVVVVVGVTVGSPLTSGSPGACWGRSARPGRSRSGPATPSWC